MKHWLVAMALICLGSTANAAWETVETNKSNCTYLAVSVSSQVPTQLLSATLTGATTSFESLMADRKTLEIQNVNGTAANYIVVGIGLSSTSANGDLSLTAPSLSTTSPNGRVVWGASEPYRENLVGKNDAGRVIVPWAMGALTTASTKVVVKQCK